ncbi:MAG: alpha/beta hydrolase [Actinomycetota bacterium]|nr:alpha/beta hydrolase [Actinomycetota bacterium]
MSPTERRVAVGDNVVLRVLLWGGGDSVPVLCVHGLASNAHTWDGVAERLHSLGHPVGAVDLRGHGHSDAPGDGYDFPTMGSDLLAVLDAVGWSRVVLAGQSTGGNLVVDLGARAPDRVVGVVGVDGGAFDLQSRWPRWEDCATVLAPPRLEGTPAASMEDHLRGAHPDWSDRGIASSMANFEVRSDGTVRPWLTFERHMRILRALWEHRPTDDLARIQVPVLLILADTGDDWSAPKRAEAEAARAAGFVEVRWFSPADHDVHIQQPDEVAELIHATFTTRPAAGCRKAR